MCSQSLAANRFEAFFEPPSNLNAKAKRLARYVFLRSVVNCFVLFVTGTPCAAGEL